MYILKKFLLGLFLGMALTIATAASLPEVRAVLFPVFISFEENGKSSSFEGEVLNYKKHLYVPVRSFAEHMGSTVEYVAPNSGSKAQVHILKLNDQDFTVSDTSKNVSIGLIEEIDVGKGEPLFIRGAIKFHKSISDKEQLVITLLDKDGNEVAASNPIKLKYREPHEMLAGEFTYFDTTFPHIQLPESYSYGIRIEQKQAWTIRQYHTEYGALGAGGLNGFPLNAYINGGSYVPNKYFDIELILLNLHDTEKVVITEPLIIEAEIYKEEVNEESKILTITSEPFTGTVNQKRGSYITNLTWDLKDSAGNPVPKGTYIVKLNLPVKAYGHMSGDPKQQVEFMLEQSMQAYNGVEIK